MPWTADLSLPTILASALFTVIVNGAALIGILGWVKGRVSTAAQQAQTQAVEKHMELLRRLAEDSGAIREVRRLHRETRAMVVALSQEVRDLAERIVSDEDLPRA